MKPIKKSILNDLIKNHDIKSLERHIIYIYLLNLNIDYSRSIILTQYFEKFEIDTQLYLNVNSLEIESIKGLENHLELLIPKEDRKLNGAFFTPDYIIDYIIKEIEPKFYDKNLGN